LYSLLAARRHADTFVRGTGAGACYDGNEVPHAMSKTAKILVVDPDQNAVLQMAGAFRQNGWEVVAAGDAVLAQSVIRKENPSAIVLSSQLPGGGAVVVVKRIRSSIYTVGTPIVVVAKPGGARKDEFLAAGANDFIVKDPDLRGLCDALRKQLGPELQPAMAAAAAAGVAAAPQAPASIRRPLPVFAPKHIVENPERLSALAEAGVLEAAPSKLLDLITGMTTTLLNVPTALLSMVDRDHEFFKSQVGVPEPWALAGQAPLSHSFCQWVVSANEIMVVEDTRQQPVLQSNLAIADMNVIAYAGVPVCSTDAGHPLGSFAAIDSRPRIWSEVELANLQNLAGMAEAIVFLESKASGRSNSARAVARAVIIQNAAQILRRIASSAARPEQASLLEIIESQAGEIADVRHAR
jgi:CheY-like chemotaxis protein